VALSFAFVSRLLIDGPDRDLDAKGSRVTRLASVWRLA
jgi:hypothetical protein